MHFKHFVMILSYTKLEKFKNVKYFFVILKNCGKKLFSRFFFKDLINKKKMNFSSYQAFHSLSAKSQVDELLILAELVIELIERVVQALVQVLQVEQDDRLAELHAQLDLMYLAAYLRVLLIVWK